MDQKSLIRAPIDRGWAWFVMLGMFVSVALMSGITKSFGIFLDEFVAHFDISVALGATVMGVSSLVYTISAPLGVSAGQHFGQRGVVVLAGLVGGLGLSLSGLLLNIEWVIVTFGVMLGFANGCTFGNGLVMVGQYFSKRRSLANGLALSGSGLGLFAIPPLLQLLLDTYSLRGTLIIVGGLYLNISVCGLLFRPLSFYDRPMKSAVTSETRKLMQKESVIHTLQASHEMDKDIRNTTTATFDVEKESPNLEEQIVEISLAVYAEKINDVYIEHGENTCEADDNTRAVNLNQETDKIKVKSFDKVKSFVLLIVDIRVMKSYVVVMMLLAAHLIYFGNFNFAIFLPAAAFSKGINKYDKAWLVSINGMLDVVGRISMGVIGDRNFLKKYKLMALSALLSGIAVLCFAFVNTFWLMGTFVALFSLSTGGYLTMFIPTIVDMFGIDVFPKVLAVMLFFQGLGVAIGQPTLGAIRDATGSYLLVHIVSAVAIAVGAGVVCLYPVVRGMENRRRRLN